jgi:peptide/nickel transport system substrate-binding protein
LSVRNTSRFSLVVAGILLIALATMAGAETPRRSGELTFVVPLDPPGYDAHQEETFALIHPAAPHYNTLLRVDPFDPTGTKIIGDLAESWTVSRDFLTYTFRLRRGVRFHDGIELTSRDVKASYDKIISPPPGVKSLRKGEYVSVDSVQAPDPQTVVFRLKWPTGSLLSLLASPFNWIYRADILSKDIHWYEKNVMGTGPFLFVEHVRGSHWVGKRNPNYWDKGKPYLDGYQALVVPDTSAQIAAIRSERAMVQFRGLSPSHRETLTKAMGERAVVQESPWNCMIVLAVNHERKPFDDRRVRRALSLALDRHQASAALAKIAIVKEVAGVLVPGTPFAASSAELERLAGFSRDIASSRAEAKRLLREAGVGEGFSFTYKSRAVQMPQEAVGVWLIDQWRQIGLNVKLDMVDPAMWLPDVQRGAYDVASDAQCGYIVDPDLALFKFQSNDKSPSNNGRYVDRTLDELYANQSRAADPDQRRRYIREFERRLFDEEVHYIPTLQWHRIIVQNARMHGWTITPSHYLNNQLDTVWLAE